MRARTPSTGLRDSCGGPYSPPRILVPRLSLASLFNNILCGHTHTHHAQYKRRERRNARVLLCVKECRGEEKNIQLPPPPMYTIIYVCVYSASVLKPVRCVHRDYTTRTRKNYAGAQGFRCGIVVLAICVCVCVSRCRGITDKLLSSDHLVFSFFEYCTLLLLYTHTRTHARKTRSNALQTLSGRTLIFFLFV